MLKQTNLSTLLGNSFKYNADKLFLNKLEALKSEAKLIHSLSISEKVSS